MTRTPSKLLSTVKVQVAIFATAAMVLFATAFFYPTSVSAAESQSLATSQTLAAGDAEWISFDYSGNSEPITLWLDSANDSLTFAIWTSAQLAAGDSDPIGRGSYNEYTAGDSYWAGEFADAGTYYIEVQNPSGAAYTFSLYIESNGVTVAPLAESVAALTTTTESDTNSGEGEVTESDTNGGEGEIAESTTVAEVAAPSVDSWQAVAPGETVWFTVAYAGDSADLEVWAETDSDSVALAVYTNDQYGNGNDPVGRGSNEEYSKGDLFWTGNFILPDTLHIAVTNTGSATANYALHIRQ